MSDNLKHRARGAFCAQVSAPPELEGRSAARPPADRDGSPLFAFVEHFSEQRLLFASLTSSAFLIYLDPHHGTNSTRTLSPAQLGAIAVIRTALNYFLSLEMKQERAVNKSEPRVSDR